MIMKVNYPNPPQIVDLFSADELWKKAEEFNELIEGGKIHTSQIQNRRQRLHDFFFQEARISGEFSSRLSFPKWYSSRLTKYNIEAHYLAKHYVIIPSLPTKEIEKQAMDDKTLRFRRLLRFTEKIDDVHFSEIIRERGCSLAVAYLNMANLANDVSCWLPAVQTELRERGSELVEHYLHKAKDACVGDELKTYFGYW
jgi:hypothetical protein